MVLALLLSIACDAAGDEYNYVQRLVSYENLHPSPAWPLTQWTGNAASLEAAVVGAPDYDPATTAGDALGWQQGYGNYVLDFGYAFTQPMTFWHFGGINWSGVANNLVYMYVSTDGVTWSAPVQLRDVDPGGGEVFVDTYALDAFGVASARYLKVEKISGGAKTGKFVDAVGVTPEPGSQNQPPSAYAGGDLRADPGTEVVLDASGSSDPDGADDLYRYHWEQTAGRDVGLAAVSTVTPYFTVPADATHGETFTFRLTVTDRAGATDGDEITVTAVTEHPPVADAGVDQRVRIGSKTTLSGAGSTDPDGDIATYGWEQTEGPEVVLADADAVTATFTAPDAVEETLTFRLTVTDATGLSSQDDVTIMTVAYSPVYAGRVFDQSGCKSWVNRTSDDAQAALGAPDYDVDDPGNQASGWDNNSGYMVLLFDRAFSRGEGHDLAVHNFGPGTVSVAVSADGGNWTELGNLPVGSAGGEVLHIHRFDLDDYAISEEHLQLVRIVKSEGGANSGRFIDAVEAYHALEQGDHPPTAVISADTRVDPGTIVLLDGALSFDPDGDLDEYAWQQTGGPEVVVYNAGEATAYFNSGAETPHGTAFEFRLMVSDQNGHRTEAAVVITVTTNHAPVADAGHDQKIMQGTRVRLDGSGSYDPDTDDDIVEYRWVQTEGETLAFDSGVEKPLLDLPSESAGQTFVFELTVLDNGGLSAADQVKLTVVDYDPIFADSVLDWSGCKSWATRLPDGAVNALGAPDYDPAVDGDQLSGWNYNNGYMALEFRKPFVDQSGNDFAVYHFGPGPAEVYVGEDGSSWYGPATLPATEGGGGDYYTHTGFDLAEFGVSTAKFVRIVQTQSGPKTGRFIDAVEAYEAQSGPDSLTVLEGSTCILGKGAPEVNLIDMDNDEPQWRQNDGALALSDPYLPTPTFVAPPVATGETRALGFSLFLNGGATAYYQVDYTVIDNGASNAYLPADALPVMTATEKRIGISHDGDLVSLALIGDSDDDIPTLPLKPRNFIYGLIDAAQKVPSPGDAAELRIHFTTPLSSDYGWFAYNLQDGWFVLERSAGEEVDGAAFNADRTQVTLRITDGGGFDGDGEADGVVTSRTGPALKGTQEEWTDKGGGEGSCFIDLIFLDR
jgi:hypothetical protein